MKHTLSCALALTLVGGASQAATAVYDFMAEGNKSGQIGEAIFDVFDTSTNGVFVGPNLQITGKKGGRDAFVYFDNGDAGMGVCGAAIGSINQYNPGSGANLCDPGSDDGLTTTDESLHFQATSKDVLISAFYINSNHDSDSILDTVWNIGGQSFDIGEFVQNIPGRNGDVRIDVNFRLSQGETLDLFGTSGPNSYISAIAVTPVPLPAAGMMLIAGLAGLGGLRAARGRKTA